MIDRGMAIAAPIPPGIQVWARLGPCDAVVQHERLGTLRVDGDGRWITLNRGDGALHRTLDGEVVRRHPDGVRSLPPEGVLGAHAAAGALAAQLDRALVDLPRSAVRLVGGDLTALSAHLRRTVAWSPVRLLEERSRFRAAYPEPVPILPPDRTRDIVVQPATGCPSGRCRFCAFYRGAGFRVLAPEAFAAHLAAVRALFGAGLGRRDGVFLGSASAASLSQRRLLAVLAAVADALGPRRRGVAAFLDPDHAPERSTRDFEALAGAGLRHLTVGLESGAPALRVALGKSADLSVLQGSLAHQGAAGLRRGVTVLVGAGGEAAREVHLDETARAIAGLDLGPGDIIYLSPLDGGLPAGLLSEELRRFRIRLRAVTRAQLAPYRMDLFRYYA